MTSQNIKSDENWADDKEFSHNSLFKKILQEKIGEKTFIKLNHLFHDNHFAEVILSFVYAPNYPIIFDNSGYFTEFVLDQLSIDLQIKFKELSGSLNIQNQIDH